jgi:hypothetical protein
LQLLNIIIKRYIIAINPEFLSSLLEKVYAPGGVVYSSVGSASGDDGLGLTEADKGEGESLAIGGRA